jgi:hypothetical protein
MEVIYMLKIISEILAYVIIGRILLIVVGFDQVVCLSARLAELDIPVPKTSFHEGYFVPRGNMVVLGNYYKWVENGISSGTISWMGAICSDILDLFIWPILVILMIISRRRIVDGWVYIAMMNQDQG